MLKAKIVELKQNLLGRIEKVEAALRGVDINDSVGLHRCQSLKRVAEAKFTHLEGQLVGKNKELPKAKEPLVTQLEASLTSEIRELEDRVKQQKGTSPANGGTGTPAGSPAPKETPPPPPVQVEKQKTAPPPEEPSPRLKMDPLPADTPDIAPVAKPTPKGIIPFEPEQANNEPKAQSARPEPPPAPPAERSKEQAAETAELRKKLESQAQSLRNQAGLLEQHDRTDKQLRATIAELEKQLAAQKEKPIPRDTETSEIKQRADSQIQGLQAEIRQRDKELAATDTSRRRLEDKLQREIDGLKKRLAEKDRLLTEQEEGAEEMRAQAKTQAEVVEAQRRREITLTAKVSELEGQLKSKETALQEGQAAIAALDRNEAEAQVETLAAQIQERDQELNAQDTAIQRLKDQFQGEIKALTERLKEAERLLGLRDQTNLVLRNQAKAQLALLEAYRHTEEELRAKIASLEGSGKTAAAPSAEPGQGSEFKKQMQSQIESLRSTIGNNENNEQDGETRPEETDLDDLAAKLKNLQDSFENE